MGFLSQLSKALYKAARLSRDLQALSSGSPKRIAKRQINKAIGRKIIRRMWLK